MSSEPQLIDGAWWKQGTGGDWARFDFDTSSWVAGRPAGIPDEPEEKPAPAATRPLMTSYDRVNPVLLEDSGQRQVVGRRIPPTLWATLAAGVLVVLGSLGPWVTFFVFSVSGTTSELGVATLVMGAATAGLAILRMNGKGGWTLITSAIGFGLCAIVGILVWARLEMLTNGDDLFAEALSVGWGLVIMTIAAVVGVVVSVVCLRTPVAGQSRVLAE